MPRGTSRPAAGSWQVSTASAPSDSRSAPSAAGSNFGIGRLDRDEEAVGGGPPKRPAAKAECQNCGNRFSTSTPAKGRQRTEQHDQLEGDGDVGRQAEQRLAADRRADSRTAFIHHCITSATAAPAMPAASTSHGSTRGPDAHRPLHAVDGEGAVGVPAAIAGLADLRARRPPAPPGRRTRPAGPDRSDGGVGVVRLDRARSSSRTFPCGRRPAPAAWSGSAGSSTLSCSSTCFTSAMATIGR